MGNSRINFTTRNTTDTVVLQFAALVPKYTHGRRTYPQSTKTERIAMRLSARLGHHVYWKAGSAGIHPSAGITLVMMHFKRRRYMWEPLGPVVGVSKILCNNPSTP